MTARPIDVLHISYFDHYFPSGPRDVTIDIEFSESVNNVDPDDTDWYTFTCDSTSHPLQTNFSTAPVHLNLSLESPDDNLLPAGAMCTLTIIPDQITTPAGTTITCNVDFPCELTFTVGSASIPPPMFVSSDPAHDATNIPINSNIILTFNVDVSATNTAFSLTCGSDPDPVAFTRTCP